jgi:hypothetical protein
MESFEDFLPQDLRGEGFGQVKRRDGKREDRLQLAIERAIPKICTGRPKGESELTAGKVKNSFTYWPRQHTLSAGKLPDCSLFAETKLYICDQAFLLSGGNRSPGERIAIGDGTEPALCYVRSRHASPCRNVRSSPNLGGPFVHVALLCIFSAGLPGREATLASSRIAAARFSAIHSVDHLNRPSLRLPNLFLPISLQLARNFMQILFPCAGKRVLLPKIPIIAQPFFKRSALLLAELPFFENDFRIEPEMGKK